MHADETDVLPQRHGETPPEPYSAAWWQERTTTELREIIKRGFSLGAAYDGAVAETERRAREAVRRAREQDNVRRRAKFRVQIGVFVVFAILLLAIGIVDWLAF